MNTLARYTNTPFPVVDMALKQLEAGTHDTPIGQTMRRLGTRQVVDCGTTVFMEGDDADTVYHVVSGVVRCCRVTMDGRRQISRFLMAGDEMGATAVGTYSYTAEAVGNVVLYRMTRRAFDRAMREDAALRDALFDHMAAMLGSARDRMVLLGKLSASERAASFLLEMAGYLREPGGDIRLAMNRQDIADYLGMTLETVSRMFNRFRKEGLIAMATPDRIRIRDHDALERMAGTL